MYKKISSKIVFKHSRLLVEEDEVLLGSGKKIKYLRYGYPGDGVVIIAKNNIGQTLFVNEYSYVQNKKMLQLPMGKIEKEEDVLIAANRELKEETGYKAGKLLQIGSYYQNYRRSNNKGFVLLATDLEIKSSVIKADVEEDDIQNVWLSAEELALHIKDGSITDSDTLSSLQIYEQLYK